MRLYDIGTHTERVSLEHAVFKGLSENGSLYMPESIPQLPPSFFEEIDQMSFSDLSFEVAKALIGDDIPENALRNIIEDAIDFPAPLVSLDEDCGVLELFHGPSLAFKDFGARFMARVMSYFLKKRGGHLHILVATSGDTGGAVAAGFYGTPNIRVSILYPSGKVSPLQEKQLTTWGKNITALEIKGSFDDCQALVKQAFTDPDLAHLPLSSANSINIARLIPQTFYYFEAFRQVPRERRERVVFSVPSGNFGNLTAGLIAKRMGLPAKFIAATNANRVVPDYLERAEFRPRPSIATLSNAMDVGNPSNFSRMLELYGSTWNIGGRGFWSVRGNFDPARVAAQLNHLRFYIMRGDFDPARRLTQLNHLRFHIMRGDFDATRAGRPAQSPLVRKKTMPFSPAIEHAKRSRNPAIELSRNQRREAFWSVRGDFDPARVAAQLNHLGFQVMHGDSDPVRAGRRSSTTLGQGGERCSTWNMMREDVQGASFTDEETIQGIQKYFDKYHYTFDPHGAIGMLAWEKLRNEGEYGIILETAHPAKFLETMESALGRKVEIPRQLQAVADREKVSIVMEAGYEGFKGYLLKMGASEEIR